MAITAAEYNSYKAALLDGTAPDWDTNTIKVALCTSSYTPNIDDHDFFDDITNEISGTGYTANGKTIASLAVTQDNTNDKGYVDGADVTWTAGEFTARYAIVYQYTGTPSTSDLMYYIDFGADVTVDEADLILSWAATGLLEIE